ncbi:lysosomal-associated transmembrane protein 4A-like [Musca domestica]|uniref:Lysosomal-associated transmembrane protein 4A n=1 Tax=Musca domestica TaxID=7370 RepID=A0A1I8MLS3_MUSDO|nr:lysosomal-associated transmembrane protein 4A [Musca domestica]XP_005186583.1 lysosomal-associated transmembrane protein 4A [Musca domestica]XP_058975281.1 lysosomal-associated transmembrane protein 4A [Musca domestica]XP_058979688.1 lysosomal-associated transmembrane protein 4A-like [Musca domestica]XP_058979689.1 lysosomal-associated transmembrane protein 4A-like [Musca domestica]XP_058979690.1 lysosomal-associated transmembrane protein 4A-like [Musca domestica]
MIRIRRKMGPHQPLTPNNNKEWICCFNLHVLTATIMIGLWHLFLNILALSLLAVIMRNPHMMEELENSYDYNVDMNAPALPTPLSKVDPPFAYRDHSLIYRKQYQSYDMGGLVCTCMIAITMMMIYGAIKGKPSHLLPFFCLQLFDFAITTLTAAGYLCYLQAIHRLIDESHRLPWREKLLELSPEELVIVVLIVFVCIVFLKAYAIGIVWRCYKYLTLRQQSMRTLLPMGISDLAGSSVGSEERAYSTLLPNYDEAVAAYMKQAPPPSYQVAMSNLPREEPNNGPEINVAAGADEDNNNDTSNNNNTVHINNNTPTMRRNNNVSGDSAVAIVGDSNNDLSPPPSYNEVIIEPELPTNNGPTTGGSIQHLNPSSSTNVQPNSNESHA